MAITRASYIQITCFSTSDNIRPDGTTISKTYPEARSILADILITDLFPKLISKTMLDELSNSLESYIEEAWHLHIFPN
ncbi:unnamed protein product, partial [Rotaria sp. Silwood1]